MRSSFVVVFLLSASVFVSAVRAEPSPIAPIGAPALRIDLATAFGEGPSRALPYAFAGVGERTRVFLYEEWSELTEHHLRARIVDPVKKKDVSIFGPVVASAAGGGEGGTPDAERQSIQAALDAALGAERYRPASVSDASDADNRIVVPVRSARVDFRRGAVVATFDAGGKPRTRKVPVAVPTHFRKVCDAGRSLLGVARVHYDDTVPWLIADVVLECESKENGDASLTVPVLVDLR